MLNLSKRRADALKRWRRRGRCDFKSANSFGATFCHLFSLRFSISGQVYHINFIASYFSFKSEQNRLIKKAKTVKLRAHIFYFLLAFFIVCTKRRFRIRVAVRATIALRRRILQIVRRLLLLMLRRRQGAVDDGDRRQFYPINTKSANARLLPYFLLPC